MNKQIYNNGARGIITTILLPILLWGCQNVTPPPPDYASADCWYIADPLSGNTPFADVFYIIPTCIEDWSDSTGNTFHHMDIYNKEQREKATAVFETARIIFGDSCRFFSPYYRQIALGSWVMSNTIIQKRFELAQEDLNLAFDYYMKHHNNGRPFILAGFSQGARGVVELLKRLSPKQYRQMIAAYAIGARITDEDIAASRFIIPAKDSIDIGVTICFNSVSRPQSACVSLMPNDVCINPISWCTDNKPANLNDSVTVEIDQQNHLLIVKGLNEEAMFKPHLQFLFPPGNFHLYEYTLFGNKLTENIAARIRSYQKQYFNTSNE